MVLTTLNYFGTRRQSKLGILRGLIAFVILFTFEILRRTLISRNYSLLILSLQCFIVVSAITVQLPRKNIKEVFLYGFLVGFSIFGFSSLESKFKDDNISWLDILVYTILESIYIALIATVTFYISSYFNLYKI